MGYFYFAKHEMTSRWSYPGLSLVYLGETNSITVVSLLSLCHLTYLHLRPLLVSFTKAEMALSDGLSIQISQSLAVYSG